MKKFLVVCGIVAALLLGGAYNNSILSPSVVTAQVKDEAKIVFEKLRKEIIDSTAPGGSVWQSWESGLKSAYNGTLRDLRAAVVCESAKVEGDNVYLIVNVKVTGFFTVAGEKWHVVLTRHVGCIYSRRADQILDTTILFEDIEAHAGWIGVPI